MWSLKQDMSSMQENQREDRELSSELIESPVNPAFLRMSTTFNGSPTFHLQVRSSLALAEAEQSQPTVRYQSRRICPRSATDCPRLRALELGPL